MSSIGRTVNSYGLAAFATDLYSPTTTSGVSGQVVLQEVGDSKRNPNVGGANTNSTTQWNLCAGTLRNLNLPFNGLMVSAGGSAAYCGGYTNMNGSAGLDGVAGTFYFSDNTRVPGATFTDGTTPKLPVIARDVQLKVLSDLTLKSTVINNVLNSAVLPSNRSSSLNIASIPVTHRQFTWHTSRSHLNTRCLAGKNSASNEVIFTSSGATNNTVRVHALGTVTSTADQDPKDQLTYDGDGVARPVVRDVSNDLYVSLGADFRWLTIGPGVYLQTPIAIGSTTTADHVGDTYYTLARLTEWYTKAPTPTHLIVDLGQNLTSAESTALGLGDNSVYKDNLEDVVDKHLAAIAAANTANSVTGPTVQVCLFGLYRTGYTAEYNNLMADAQYDLAVARGWSFFNTYKVMNDYAVAQGTSVTDGQGVTGRMPIDTTYLCDGVHPNNAGVLAITAQFQIEMQVAMQANTAQPTYGFEWNDPLEIACAASSLPEDYTIDGGIQAIASGNLELRMPGRVLKSKRGTDWLIGDGNIKLPPFVSKTGNTDRVRLIACKDGADHYYCELTLAGANTPYVFGRAGVNTATYGSGTHGSAIVATDELWLTRSGTTLTLYKNGASIAPATISDSTPLVTGEWGVEGPYILGSTVKFGGTTGFRVGVTTPYTPPSDPAPGIPWLAKLIINYDSTEGNAQAQAPDTLWNSGWEAQYGTRLDRFIANGGKRIWIRGEGGNNTQGNNSGRSWSSTSPSSPAIIQLANMMNMHGAGYLRTGSNYTTPPADGRLANGFMAFVASRRNSLDAVYSYIPLPPNGRSHSDSAASCIVWPNTTTAHDFYFIYVRNLGMTPAFDFAGSLDPDHAQSVAAKAALDRSKTYSTNRRPILEAHTRSFVGYSGGTFANNLAMATSGDFDFASPEPQYDTLIATPADWTVPARSTVIFDSNAGSATVRLAKAALARAQGFNVVCETDDFTSAQEATLIGRFDVSYGRASRSPRNARVSR